MNFIGVMIF